MKTTKKIYSITLALTCCLTVTLKAQDIYVANYDSGTIGEYTTSGTTINADLVSGTFNPVGMVFSGNDLFVESWQRVGEYTTSGETVNASLFSGLDEPQGLAISGNDLFVANLGSGYIGE